MKSLSKIKTTLVDALGQIFLYMSFAFIFLSFVIIPPDKIVCTDHHEPISISDIHKIHIHLEAPNLNSSQKLTFLDDVTKISSKYNLVRITRNMSLETPNDPFLYMQINEGKGPYSKNYYHISLQVVRWCYCERLAFNPFDPSYTSMWYESFGLSVQVEPNGIIISETARNELVGFIEGYLDTAGNNNHITLSERNNI